jgi:phenylalanyl-tRNA synthetase beta subunit
MKIYEYTAEATDFKIHDFMAAENKKQATEKIKKAIAKLGYQQPKTLNLYSTKY